MARVKKNFKDFRFYANSFPKINDLVKVKVKSIHEYGLWVSLLEYNKQKKDL
eukprot:EC821090.1.p2 GENE.EC821090.1~~EC821090.1.p2  ORF type:complete len:52 (+),score=10.21 EC821090.1:59-214(+)